MGAMNMTVNTWATLTYTYHDGPDVQNKTVTGHCISPPIVIDNFGRVETCELPIPLANSDVKCPNRGERVMM